MRKVLDSQHFFIANIIFSVVIATSIFYISEDYPLSALLFFAPLFTHLSAITLLPLKQGKPRKDDIITGVTFLSSWFLPLLCYLFVPTVGFFSLLLVFIIVAVGGFLSYRERPFEFDSQTSKRHKDFELDFWNQLIVEETLESGKKVLNKKINNRAGITVTDIRYVKQSLRKLNLERVQELIDFLDLPVEQDDISFSVLGMLALFKRLFSRIGMLLFTVVSTYALIQEILIKRFSDIVDWLEKDLEVSVIEFSYSLFLLILVMIYLVFVITIIISSFSTHTKSKQVKQILPKLLKDVLEEKQFQHYHSRQFPKRWLK